VSTVAQQMIFELMLLKRDLEVVTERFDPLVTLADPLGTKFADEIGSGELMR
jgi:hypothetical protein